MTEPQITRKLPDKVVQSYIETRECFIPQKIPALTRAVLGANKLVSNAFVKVCDNGSRVGFVKSSFNSRSRIPSFVLKIDHVVN